MKPNNKPDPKTRKKSKSKDKSKEKTALSKSKVSIKKKTSRNFHEDYLNQNIVINKKQNLATKNNYKRDIFSAMNSRNQKVQSVASKKRPVSSFGCIRKSMQIKNILKYDINELVTEEDVILISEGVDQSRQNKAQPILHYVQFKLTEVQAAILIQKMWRGYQTRKLIKYYLNLYKRKNRSEQKKKQKSKEPNLKRAKKTKKLSDVVNMPEKNNVSESESDKLKKRHNQQYGQSQSKKPTQINQMLPIEQSLNKLKNEQLEKWNEIIELINQIPKEQINNNSLLFELIKKSRQNKSKLESLNQPINLSPTKPSQQLKNCDKPSPRVSIHSKEQSLLYMQQSENHPLLKIFEFRLKVMKNREKLELSKLEDKLKAELISKIEYDNRKQRITAKYIRQRKEIYQNKSQISFGLQKAHQAILNSKKDAEFLYKITGKNTFIRNCLSSQTLFESFIKNKFILQNTPTITPTSSVESLHIPHRILTQLESPGGQSPKYNLIQSESHLKNLKNSAEKIQPLIQKTLIQEICLQIFTNEKLYKTFQPLVDIHNTYVFRKVQDQDISNFLNHIDKHFMPTETEILARLNQKINPTPVQLLKILRNQELSLSSQGQFYELVVPEESFKRFREWKQSLIVQQLAPKGSEVLFDNLDSNTENIIRQRNQQIRERKKKLLKFEKDLQAMFFKSVFNCFNQSIIQVKSSYSPLNSRSTIGPGQLQVALLDSNTIIKRPQIKSLIKKAKQRVVQNLKYKCPFLLANNYNQLYRFQQTLTKQIAQEMQTNEFRWASFFDQILQIAMELSKKIQQALLSQVMYFLFQSNTN